MNQKLYIRNAQGDFVAGDNALVMAAARAHLQNRMRRGATLDNPSCVREYLTVTLGDRECEYFCVILLDTRHRVIRYVELFRGTIDGASVYPREVLKLALQANAAAVILVHNHPSTVAEPSFADEAITQRIRDAMSMVDIRVLDHLIVAGTTVVSFAERGLLLGTERLQLAPGCSRTARVEGRSVCTSETGNVSAQRARSPAWQLITTTGVPRSARVGVAVRCHGGPRNWSTVL